MCEPTGRHRVVGAGLRAQGVPRCLHPRRRPGHSPVHRHRCGGVRSSRPTTPRRGPEEDMKGRRSVPKEAPKCAGAGRGRYCAQGSYREVREVREMSGKPQNPLEKPSVSLMVKNKFSKMFCIFNMCYIKHKMVFSCLDIL